MTVSELRKELKYMDPDTKVTLTCEGKTYPLLAVDIYNDECDLGGGWVPMKDTD